MYVFRLHQPFAHPKNVLRKRRYIINISLIGMPGAGKSTVGVVLAKCLGMEFIDTDILLQNSERRTLEQILKQQGFDQLWALEGQLIQQLDIGNAVIATGGSAVYNLQAMENLHDLSIIVYLQLSTEKLRERLGDFAQRGIAAAPGTSLDHLANERLPLYEKYADHTVNCDNYSLEEVVDEVIDRVCNNNLG